ncbi:MAG TPA: DUF1343 domain-containing protein [Bacteroidales bacterium]|nr:DUF1343 domain-containing protein [Bacteroidales bacterium]
MKVTGLVLGLFILVSSCQGSTVISAKVKTGADRTEIYIPLLKGKSVALVANHTTIIGRTHLVDSLTRRGVHIVKIFSPEHGFRGNAGAGDAVKDAKDPLTGIPVVSLYGQSYKPSKADLKGTDLVIYDIQDVGVRFYTYISTMHYVLEACAESGIPIIILDRPDPLGFYVDGPVLDTAFRSFVGMHPIPVVYGMTPGELAQMINSEGWLSNHVKCNLTVIPCTGYDHRSRYTLPVFPSPNLNSMEAVYLYPSVCLFEGTVMSLGRGTDYPFRVIGHPDYPDHSFSFIPKVNAANSNPLFVNKTCFGIDLRSLKVADLENQNKINLQWLIRVFHAMNTGSSFFIPYISKLAGSDNLKRQVVSGLPELQIRQSWEKDIAAFKKMRKKYLLYDDFE